MVVKFYNLEKKQEVFILVNYKVCKCCKLNKPREDFIGESKECFRCVYRKKTLMQEYGMEEPLKPRKLKNCKECGKKLEGKRWVFCSLECASGNKAKSRHWTQLLKRNPKEAYRKFDFRKTWWTESSSIDKNKFMD